MLYENEEVEFFDPETGAPTKEFRDAHEDAEFDKVITQGQKLESLQKNRGWKVLDAWINESVAHYKELLVHEQDVAKIARLQEAIKSYSNVQAFVKIGVLEGKEFLERKRTLALEDNPKE